MPIMLLFAMVLALPLQIHNIGATATTSGISTPISAIIESIIIPKTYEVLVTAYSSSYDETDDTPFITASGKRVRDGVIAANFLPLGTRVTIPHIFGDKIFTVEDRMHERNAKNVDIWMPSKNKALRFGIIRAEIVVLDGFAGFEFGRGITQG